jgi:hypothetical protein
MVTNLAMFGNESSFELYGCLLTNRCLVMSGSTLPLKKKKKKKTITCSFISCSFTYYVTLLFSIVKHQQKISSVYGGHIKNMIFPLQKKGMDVLFFEMPYIFFLKFL